MGAGVSSGSQQCGRGVVTVRCQPTQHCALPCCHRRLSTFKGRCVLFLSSASLKAPQAVGRGLPLSHASSGFAPFDKQLWAGQDPHHPPSMVAGVSGSAVLSLLCGTMLPHAAQPGIHMPAGPWGPSPAPVAFPPQQGDPKTRLLSTWGEVSSEGLWQACRGVPLLRAPSCPCGATASPLARFLLLISVLECEAAPRSRGRHLIMSGVDTAL